MTISATPSGTRLQPVNVASVRQLSPFRYPGGKTWFVPYVRHWLRRLPARPRLFVEPFAGGGIIGLTVGAERLAEAVLLVELDERVASVWQEILYGDVDWLTNEILSFEPTRARVIERLAQQPRSNRELAFQTLLRNRVQRGGIMAPGASLVKHGENGRGLRSRWYPQTLVRRIREIRAMRHRIKFLREDGLQVIQRLRRRPGCAFFVDPPYTAGGKKAGRRLYAHNNVDHRRLFRLLAGAAGPVMITYDEAPEVLSMASHWGLSIQRVPMKNAHHATMFELVLTNRGSCLAGPQVLQGTLFD